jgi:hypothetical protein
MIDNRINCYRKRSARFFCLSNLNSPVEMRGFSFEFKSNRRLPPSLLIENASDRSHGFASAFPAGGISDQG